MNEVDWSSVSAQACVTIQGVKRFFHGTHLDMLQTKMRQGFEPGRKFYAPNQPTSFHLKSPQKILRFTELYGKEIRKEQSLVPKMQSHLRSHQPGTRMAGAKTKV